MSRLRIFLVLLVLLAAISAPALVEGYAAVARADAAYAGQDFGRAAAAYDTAARLLVWRPELLEKAAIAYASARNWERAMPLFQRARLRGGLSADGWDVFGTGYWLQSRNQDALEAWSIGFKRHPAELKFAARLALAYRGLGDYDAERRSLLAWVASGKATAAEHYRLGQLLMDSDAHLARQQLQAASSMDAAFAPAVDTLTAALDAAARQPDQAQQLVLIGRGLGLVNEWPLAERAFEESTQADPQNGDASAWLGEARQHVDQDGKAELDRALALAPASTTVHALRALRFKRAGDYAAALSEYRRAAELEPGNPEWQAALGEAHALTGDLVSALAAYQKATTLAPQDASYWRLLAMFCADNGVQVMDVGLPAAKKAQEIAPGDAQVLDALGWSYAQAGLLYNAVETLTKATKQAPDLALVHLHLGETYLRRGDPAAALRELRLALELDTDGPVGALAARLLHQYFP